MTCALASEIFRPLEMHYSTAFPYSNDYDEEDNEMKLVMFLGQVNHGITKEDAKKVANFLQLESKHSQKLMDETPENVRPSG